MTRIITYKSIKANYKSPWYIPYDVLLNTIEWREFRQKIIDRDCSKCKVCNKEQSEKTGRDYFRKPTVQEIAENSKEQLVDLLGDGTLFVKMKNAPIVGIKTDSPTILHVHHKYYILGRLPWEYKSEALVTVCHNCHVKIHDEEMIPVFVDDSFKEKIDLTPCDRCNGTGFLEQHFHVQNGICFRCNGRKFEEFIA
ncbi:hypothetical protein ACWKWU_07400 [Chitinophaga lutea]